jgi:predicted O-methyltransferase YrrM
MKFKEVSALVGDTPFISAENGRFLYDLIIREGLTNILELGIAHGTATCYMAAALEELGAGLVTAVDLTEADVCFRPSAEEQLGKSNLGRFARIVRMQTGYPWFLHDEIRSSTCDGVCRPSYDLCIIDGPKNWTIDGLAFFLVDKLLLSGGWLIFDDYLWTYAGADSRRDSTDGITHRRLSDEERNTPHIKEIIELLVMQHPSYSTVSVFDTGDWAIARKVASERKTFTVVHRESNRAVLAALKGRLKRLLELRR